MRLPKKVSKKTLTMFRMGKWWGDKPPHPKKEWAPKMNHWRLVADEEHIKEYEFWWKQKKIKLFYGQETWYDYPCFNYGSAFMRAVIVKYWKPTDPTNKWHLWFDSMDDDIMFACVFEDDLIVPIMEFIQENHDKPSFRSDLQDFLEEKGLKVY